MEEIFKMYNQKLNPSKKDKNKVWEKTQESVTDLNKPINKSDKGPQKSTKFSWFTRKKLLISGILCTFLLIVIIILPISYIFLTQNRSGLGNSSDLIDNMEQKSNLEKIESCTALNDSLKDYYKAQEEDKSVMYDSAESESLSMGTPSPLTGSRNKESSNMTTDESPDFFTTTNVQVEGIDEGDTVKTDGKNMYVLDAKNKKINLLKIYPFKEAQKVNEIEFDDNESPTEMLLNDNKLIVFTNKYLPYPLEESGEIDNTENETNSSSNTSSETRSDYSVPPFKRPQIRKTNFVTMHVIDIEDMENPETLRTIELEGRLETTRFRDGYVYLINNKSYYYWNYPLYETMNNSDEIDVSNSENSSKNPGSIIPLIKNSQKSDKYELSCGCSDISILDKDNIYPQITSIMAINIDNRDADPKVHNYIGNAETVYMSYESIYFASTNYNYRGGGILDSVTDSYEYTILNKISYSQDQLNYVNSAKFRGKLLNQFSLDEYDGYLRLAGTRGNVWDQDNKSENYLLTFDNNLNHVGEIRDLARGERIYSARFYGNIGVIVTFKKIDPLFVFDLSEGKNPKLKGELKIPGYSDYLHFIDKETIIGLGKDTIEAQNELKEDRNMDFAWYQGIKMAIFDISNLENPIEKSKLVLGDRGTDSIALHDHHAFVYDRKHELIIIPATIHEVDKEKCEKKQYRPQDLNACYGEAVSQGAQVIEINKNKELKLKGEVTHFDTAPETERFSSYSEYAVKRNIVIDDTLISISDMKIKLNDIFSLNEFDEIELTKKVDPDDQPIVID